MKKKTTLIINLVLLLGIYAIFTIGCKKDNKDEKDPEPTPTTGTITDADGHTYKTIKIGDQWWMAENLKTTKYNDGTEIPFVVDSIAWSNLSTAAYCWYNNEQTINGNTYGALYNWFAVNSGKLSPTGWHVASESDWGTLITHLGGELAAGGKLKETGFTHWLSPNTGATNETAFTGLPGGYRYYNGTFFGIGCGGFWWSATEIDANEAWYYYTYYLSSSIQKKNNFKRSGLTVRCVKD